MGEIGSAVAQKEKATQLRDVLKSEATSLCNTSPQVHGKYLINDDRLPLWARLRVVPKCGDPIDLPLVVRL